MQPARIAFTLVAVAAAGFLVFRGCFAAKAPDKPAAAQVPATPEAGPAAPWSPFQDPVKPQVPSTAREEARRPAPPPEVGVDVPGTPVKPGAEVSLVVPYKTGTKSRYRVTEAQAQRDLAADVEQWWQWIWTVSTEVTQAEPDGAARVRFQIDGFRFRTSTSARRIEFDSANPDNALLADESLGLGRTFRPLLAILGMPVEFKLDSGGTVRAVEGVSALNRRFLDVVDTFGAREVREAIDAPTSESLTERWSEMLFPPVVGGTLKEGTTRPASFQTTYYERWAAIAAGKLRATHDDSGVFRVEFRGKPEVKELNRPAKSSMARSIVKAQVVSSADSYVAAWRFDRAAGRLLDAQLVAKYRFDISRGTRPGPDGAEQPDARFTQIERRISVEHLDK